MMTRTNTPLLAIALAGLFAGACTNKIPDDHRVPVEGLPDCQGGLYDHGLQLKLTRLYHSKRTKEYRFAAELPDGVGLPSDEESHWRVELSVCPPARETCGEGSAKRLVHTGAFTYKPKAPKALVLPSPDGLGCLSSAKLR